MAKWHVVYNYTPHEQPKQKKTAFFYVYAPSKEEAVENAKRCLKALSIKAKLEAVTLQEEN